MGTVNYGVALTNNTYDTGTLSLAGARQNGLNFYVSQGYGVKFFGSDPAAALSNYKATGYGSIAGEKNPLFTISGKNTTQSDFTTMIANYFAYKYVGPTDLCRIAPINEVTGNTKGVNPAQWGALVTTLYNAIQASPYKARCRVVYCGMAYQDVAPNGASPGTFSSDYLEAAGANGTTHTGGMVDEIGIDCYGGAAYGFGSTLNYTKATIDNSVALATKYGIPWSIPEFGVQVGDLPSVLTYLDTKAYDPSTKPFGCISATFWENVHAGTPNSPQPTDPKWSFEGTSDLALVNAKLANSQSQPGSNHLRGTNHATNDATPSTSLTVPLPAGCVVGDYAVLVVGSQETSPSYTVSNGYNPVSVSPSAANTNRSLTVFDKTLGSGDLTSVVISSTVSKNRTAVIYVMQQETGQVIDIAVGSAGWTGGTTASAPTGSTNQADETVIIVYGEQSSTTLGFTTPSGYTVGPTDGPSVAGGMTLASFHILDQAAAGSTGNPSSTVSASGNGVALTIGIGNQTTSNYSDSEPMAVNVLLGAGGGGAVVGSGSLTVGDTLSYFSSGGGGGAISVRGSTSVTNGGTASTTITCNMPAGAAVGDFAMFFVAGQDTTPSVTYSNSFAATTLSSAASNTNRSLILATKVLTASDLVSVTATFTTSKIRSAGLLVYSSSAGAMDGAIGTVGWTGGTTATAPALTTTQADDSIAVCYMTQAGSTFTWTTPTGYTAGATASPTATGGAAIAMFYLLDQGAAGSTGTPTSTTSAGNGVAITAAVVKPSGSVSSLNVSTTVSLAGTGTFGVKQSSSVTVSNALSSAGSGPIISGSGSITVSTSITSSTGIPGFNPISSLAVAMTLAASGKPAFVNTGSLTVKTVLKLYGQVNQKGLRIWNGTILKATNLFVWDGSVLNPLEVMGIWNGSSIVPIDTSP